jgi:hypothetical protein
LSFTFQFRWLPVGELELARAAGLLDLHSVLKGMHPLDILRIVRIDQDADRRDGIACADLVFGESLTAGPIHDVEHVMILIDDDHP